MTTDRKKLLEGCSRARKALAHPDLPQEIRELYKKAADHAEVALALQYKNRENPDIFGEAIRGC